jgi:hypothetical protein
MGSCQCVVRWRTYHFRFLEISKKENPGAPEGFPSRYVQGASRQESLAAHSQADLDGSLVSLSGTVMCWTPGRSLQFQRLLLAKRLEGVKHPGTERHVTFSLWDPILSRWPTDGACGCTGTYSILHPSVCNRSMPTVLRCTESCSKTSSSCTA